MEPYRPQKRCEHLLALPQELLQLVINHVPGKYTLRPTCKAFASALATCCDSVVLRRSGLRSRGPRVEVAGALAAFPNARRVVIDFGGGQAAPGAIASRSFGHDLYDDDVSVTAANSSSNSDTTMLPASDEDLLCETLQALHGRGITSLALLHLACPPPPPSALARLRPSLLELEISDSSHTRAADQGAFNLLVRERREICARSEALVCLAVSLPQLRRLSLSSAAFSVGSVAALGCLTRLESLSVVGCLECPGAAPQAAETYRTLLAVLRALRQLRLPMAVPSPSTALLDDDDDDNDNYGNNADDARVHGAHAHGHDEEHGSGGSGGGGGLFGGFFNHGPPPPQQQQQQQQQNADFWRSSMHATLSGGWPSTRALLDPWVTNPLAFPPGPAPLRTMGTIGLSAQHQQQAAAAARHPPACPSGFKHAAAFDGLMWPHAAKCGQQQPNQLAAGFDFPPNLQDLTIPLCSLNRPVFAAVCAAFDCSNADGHSPAVPAPSGGSGSLPSCSPNQHLGGRGCAQCGEHGLKGPNSAVAWRHDYQESAVDAAAAAVRSGAAARVAAGRCARPHCGGIGGAFGTRSTTPAARGCGGGGSLRSLHIPTLAGYSHWEGSFLASARDFELLARLKGVEQLHLSLDVGAFRMGRAGMRACFQHLLALRNLTELRVTEARPPTCFSARKRSAGRHHPTSRGFGAVQTSDLSGTSLQRLQRQWPQLRTLQFFSETIVRSEGNLVVPNGIDDVDLLPPPCACCTAPYLMAAPLSSVGRWGRGDPSWSHGVCAAAAANDPVGGPLGS